MGSRQRRFQQHAEHEREIQRRKWHRRAAQIRWRNLNLGGSHTADAVRPVVVVVRIRITLRVGVVRVNPACLLQQRVRRGRQPQGQQQNRHNCFQPTHEEDARVQTGCVQTLCCALAASQLPTTIISRFRLDLLRGNRRRAALPSAVAVLVRAPPPLDTACWGASS